MKVIPERYSDLVKSFCTLEADQFYFKDSKNRTDWIKTLHEQIMAYEEPEDSKGYDYVIIESITNMGLVSDSIKMSAAKYYYGQNLRVAFPTTPRDVKVTFWPTPK